MSSQVMPCDLAICAACSRMLAAAAVAISSYWLSGFGHLSRDIWASSKADQASVTVTTETGTSSFFANATPWATALLASSDPSVAMRICWYIVALQLADYRHRAY